MPGASSAGASSSSCCIPAPPPTVTRALRRSPADNKRDVESLEEWENILNEGKTRSSPIIVMFTATWCKPCQGIKPYFDTLSSDYDSIFVKIDVDELDDVATSSGVSMMPTFVVFSGGVQVDKTSGANAGALLSMIQKAASKIIAD